MRVSVPAALVAALVAIAFQARALELDLGVKAGVGEGSTEESEGWSIQLCRASTEANEVVLEVATPGQKNRQTLATWRRTANEGPVQVYEVPQMAGQGKIWVRASAKPKNSEAYLAVFHGDEAKKVLRFEDRKASVVGVADPSADFPCPTG